jgi:mRNA interferase MazF
VKRGELWTFRDINYASKARPVIIVQSDDIHKFDSVILCLFTTYNSEHISTRVRIPASPTNGLVKDSFVMTEKIVTVAKCELGEKIGELTNEQMNAISTQLAVVLGL